MKEKIFILLIMYSVFLNETEWQKARYEENIVNDEKWRELLQDEIRNSKWRDVVMEKLCKLVGVKR